MLAARLFTATVLFVLALVPAIPAEAPPAQHAVEVATESGDGDSDDDGDGHNWQGDDGHNWQGDDGPDGQQSAGHNWQRDDAQLV